MKRLATIFLAFALILSGVFSSVAFACDTDFMLTTGQVNVRKLPDRGAEVIGWLDKGEKIYPVNWISTYDGRTWVQVDWEGKDGFISDKYLEYPDDDEPIYDYEVVNTSLKMITTGSVNVRAWSALEGPILYTLDEGTMIDAISFYPSDDGRVWAEIEVNHPECNYGYISMKYLDFVDEKWPEFGQYMKVTGKTVNVRENPSVEAEVVDIICRGEKVEVYYFIPTADNRVWAACFGEDEMDIRFISIEYLKKVR